MCFIQRQRSHQAGGFVNIYQFHGQKISVGMRWYVATFKKRKKGVVLSPWYCSLAQPIPIQCACHYSGRLTRQTLAFSLASGKKAASSKMEESLINLLTLMPRSNLRWTTWACISRICPDKESPLLGIECRREG